MGHIRGAVGQEQRECQVCRKTTLFTLYDTTDRHWFRRRKVEPMAAQCETCGTRVIDKHRVVQLPD